MKVFYKANTGGTGGSPREQSGKQPSNNIFPLIAIEDSANKLNDNYLIIKINKELAIVIASVILLTLIVIVVLNNLSKCLHGSKNDAANFHFRQYH